MSVVDLKGQEVPTDAPDTLEQWQWSVNKQLDTAYFVMNNQQSLIENLHRRIYNTEVAYVGLQHKINQLLGNPQSLPKKRWRGMGAEISALFRKAEKGIL